MDGYFINLTSSTLRVGLYSEGETPRFICESLLPTTASHSQIVDPKGFAGEFSKMLAVHLGDKLPKLPLFFILEPEVTDLFLITTQKNGVGDNEYINGQIKERLVDENPDDLFFSYFKIAPFIYQFVGIKKAYMESLLEFANILGLEVGGILPLGLLLAKTNSDVSSMFVFPNNGVNTVVFSELTGVTFAEKLDGKITANELKELFWKLSVYNSGKGEINIYTYPKYAHVFGTQKVLTIAETGIENDYESISLGGSILSKQPAILDSQTNLLNILPTPQAVQSSKVPVLATAGVLSLMLIIGLVFQLTIGFNNILGKNSGPNGPKQEVLAENNKTNEQQSPTPAATPQKEIKRSDLKLRVENGNGVAGSAGKLKAYLEGLEYNVISVGNADNTDYEKTIVKLPKEFSDYKDVIIGDLKTNYTVEINDVDKKPDAYDVLIVVGLK